MFITPSLNACHKDFIGEQRLYILHLVCKNVRFVLILQIIINHAPYGCFTGAGNQSDNLNRMLSVEDVIDIIPAADFYGIDLIEIEIRCRFLDVLD